MCSQTCGCNNVLSGLWTLTDDEYGCPMTLCPRPRLDRNENISTCTDTSVEKLQEDWGWQTFIQLTQGVLGSDLKKKARKQLRNTSGCEVLDNIGYQNPSSFRKLCTLSGAAAFCPITCNCHPRVMDQGNEIKYLPCTLPENC